MLIKALKSKVKKLLNENCSKRKNNKWYVKIDIPKNNKNLKTPILNKFKSTSFSISSFEEIAYKNGWIDDEQMLKISNKYSKNQYGTYLKSLVLE